MRRGIFSVFCLLIVFSSHAQKALGDSMFPTRRLQTKAYAAQSGDDFKLRDLALEVFNPIGNPSDPTFASIAEPLVDRLYRAEKDYRTTGQGRIPVANVSKAVNSVMKTLGGPEYALTTNQQVHFLAMSVQRVAPTFMAGIGKDLKKEQFKPEPEYNLSPLQATHLTVLMLKQKFGNPSFQLTHEEWELLRNQRAATLADTHSEAERKNVTDRLLREDAAAIAQNPKRTQMLQLLIQYTAGKRPDELRAAAEAAMDILGVER